ncbi:hypothetical protein BJ742DRAFT_738669 [Cladochytrium replicatum]|nr:hypothetical protein BJ742DRAFT_738669 [Cladochytrium replicatum]
MAGTTPGSNQGARVGVFNGVINRITKKSFRTNDIKSLIYRGDHERDSPEGLLEIHFNWAKDKADDSAFGIPDLNRQQAAELISFLTDPNGGNPIWSPVLVQCEKDGTFGPDPSPRRDEIVKALRDHIKWTEVRERSRKRKRPRAEVAVDDAERLRQVRARVQAAAEESDEIDGEEDEDLLSMPFAAGLGSHSTALRARPTSLPMGAAPPRHAIDYGDEDDSDSPEPSAAHQEASSQRRTLLSRPVAQTASFLSAPRPIRMAARGRATTSSERPVNGSARSGAQTFRNSTALPGQDGIRAVEGQIAQLRTMLEPMMQQSIRAEDDGRGVHITGDTNQALIILNGPGLEALLSVFTRMVSGQAPVANAAAISSQTAVPGGAGADILGTPSTVPASTSSSHDASGTSGNIPGSNGLNVDNQRPIISDHDMGTTESPDTRSNDHKRERSQDTSHLSHEPNLSLDYDG